ncbi:MAG: phosphatidylglycerophosphatase A [Rhodocyclaceae bacterium]|jgi:phosphatidylglycerophosphatase (EC 3.1.3.27)|nr:phosphatidylglycerophosphatase A [Rhodocyclaceae bacterium]MCL4760043.1 phosphatidylglycerophosphatase A [Rhodocyclaceae bacterium]
MRPTANFLFSHPSHFIALGFGAGLAPRAPGTAGTLLAWALYPLIKTPVSDFVFLAFLASLFAAGVIAAERAGRALGVPDHGAIVWDEMVAMWLVLLFTPPTLLWQAVAVVLFRFFDIVKPQPVRWADEHFKGGFGVMLDDLIAAGYALLVLALLVHFFGDVAWMRT